ncbi:kinase-like protein [Russula decolorans]
MSPRKLDHIADQLIVISQRNALVHECDTEVHRSMFLDFCGPKYYVEKLFSCFSTEAKTHLTHGDLLPHNILVKGSKITGIFDWETAGYYPEFWEYCRMHDTCLGLRPLGRIFPGPRREKEIEAVRDDNS